MNRIRVLVGVLGMDQHELGAVGIAKMLRDAGIRFNDLQTKQSSLEEIFVDLVKRER